MWACNKGNFNVARKLLNHGADVRLGDSLGATAFIIAIQHRHIGLFFIILNRDDGILYDRDVNGCTAMHWAAFKGEIEMVRMM